MFFIGYLFGVITSGLLLCLGYYAHRFAFSLETGQNKDSAGAVISRVFQRNKPKKKPKFLSEEQEWAREQKQAPLDPGL